MIKIENTDVTGWIPAVRGMRNPLNSWDKSDSLIGGKHPGAFVLGEADRRLMHKLAAAGTDHAKYRRMIVVTCDVTAPLYWWKEADTYKVGTVANSCSTMHKIAAKEFTLDDFSTEHLFNDLDVINGDKSVPFEKDPALSAVTVDGDRAYFTSTGFVKMTCDILNHYRDLFLKTHDKKYWWQMIQLLPSSYNQKRTLMLSYEVLANIHKSRKNHKLDEWHDFCAWIEELPEAEGIIFPVKKALKDHLDEEAF